MKLSELNKQIKACSKCPLRMEATQPVCGIGEIGARYLLIGEAPGQQEDKAGVPFVGAAGKRLDKLLKLAKMDINDCYLTNVCRCKPPQNRDPRKAEIKACIGYLWEEIKLVKPEYLITLGRLPLSLFTPIGVRQLHGTMMDVEIELPDDVKYSCPLIIQYHPAAALHVPRLWASMLDDWEHPPEKVDANYSIDAELQGTIIDKQPFVALDTENEPDGSLGLWSIAYRNGDGELRILPFYKGVGGLTYKTLVVMHNAKWDLKVLQMAKMKEPENIADTMIAAYCLGYGFQDVKDSAKGKSGDQMVGGLGLKYLARRHLGLQMKTWQEIKDEPENIPEYNAMDSVATYLLFEKWKPQLPEHFWTIDMPLLRVIMAMEDRGIQVDPAFLKKFAESLDRRLKEFDLPINVFAPEEVRGYIYGFLEIEPWKFTGNGAPSTDAEVLEKIDDPIVKQILEYKALYKELGTYASSYMKKIGLDGRIHTEFKQTRTATGRLSSANPNLQNVVKEGDMRKLFIAPEGKVIIRLDWKLVEFGMLAALTQDETLLEAFRSTDFHQTTADALGVDRDTGKHINFQIQNGGSAWGMSRQYGIPIDLAKSYFKRYYERFPAAKLYHEEIVADAVATKKVYGYFGRMRRLDALYAEDWRVREEGKREAMTMPMQNGAAEIVKLAMIDLHYKHSAPMMLQVHDELLFEVDQKDAKEYAHWLKEYVPTLTEVNGVYFPVSVGIGQNWKESAEKENEI